MKLLCAITCHLLHLFIAGLLNITEVESHNSDNSSSLHYYVRGELHSTCEKLK